MKRRLPRWRGAAEGGPPLKIKRGFGGPPRVIATAVFIFLASQLIAAFIAELGLAIAKPHSQILLSDSISGQAAYILIAESLAVLFTVKLVKRRAIGLTAIGLGRRPLTGDIIKAAIGFAVFYGILIVASIAVNAWSPDLNKEQQDLGFTNISNGMQNSLAFISLVILPPLGEETLVRGYLYSGLRKAWRFWPAVLATSLLFGLAHLELGSGGPLVWAAALDTFLLSIVLCFLREKTGAIYAGILVHMANNLIAFGVHFK